jgi:hypothetical protein
MPVENASVDAKIRKQLGEQGLQLVLSSLWAVDCQTCGRPLHGDVPALAIEDAISFFTASLHHPRCRRSQWNDKGALRYSGQAHLSYTCISFILPMKVDGIAAPRAAFVVNPGLEMLFLERGPDGWALQHEAPFTMAGLSSTASAPLQIDKPVSGALARLHGDEVTVSFSTPPMSTYTTRVVADTRALIEQHRGILLFATHAVNPPEARDLSHLRGVLTGDRTIGGWVGLDR